MSFNDYKLDDLLMFVKAFNDKVKITGYSSMSKKEIVKILDKRFNIEKDGNTFTLKPRKFTFYIIEDVEEDFFKKVDDNEEGYNTKEKEKIMRLLKVLGLEKWSSKEVIRKTYKRLAKVFHPDKESGDEGKFIEVDDAYKMLLKLLKKSNK